MIVDGGGGQDAAVHTLDLLSLQVEGDVLGVVDIDIGQRDMDTSVLVFGGGGAYHRHFAVIAYFGFVADQVHRQESGILVHVVHLEYIVGRREQHFRAVCQDHGLEHVDDLGDVGHFDAVGIFVEHVQGKGCHESIAHGVLLVQVAVDRSRLFVPPSAPFVHHQADLLLRVVFVHDLDMFFDDIFYFEAFAHCPVIVVLVEIRGRSFAAAPPRYRVIVQGKSVHAAAYVFHQCFRPVVVVVAGSAGDLEKAVPVVVAAIGGVAAVEVGVIFGAHASATSPAFVADTDEFDFPCLIASVLPAQAGHRAVAFRSHIFDPFGHLFNGSATDVGTDIRFAA